jgi:DNA-binding LytR/AlgR family response regulator
VTIATIIVDHELAGRRTLREHCERVPALSLVGEYADALTALDGILQHAPGLLFVDIRMSGMSGIELARALPRDAMPSIVFVTAYDE